MKNTKTVEKVGKGGGRAYHNVILTTNLHPGGPYLFLREARTSPFPRFGTRNYHIFVTFFFNYRNLNKK